MDYDKEKGTPTMTLERAESLLKYIKDTRPKRGPMMINLSVGEIESMLVSFILMYKVKK